MLHTNLDGPLLAHKDARAGDGTVDHVAGFEKFDPAEDLHSSASV